MQSSGSTSNSRLFSQQVQQPEKNHQSSLQGNHRIPRVFDVVNQTRHSLCWEPNFTVFRNSATGSLKRCEKNLFIPKRHKKSRTAIRAFNYYAHWILWLRLRRRHWHQKIDIWLHLHSERRKDCMGQPPPTLCIHFHHWGGMRSRTKAAKESVWLRRLLIEIVPELKQPLPLICHNISLIELTRSPKFHQRNKHTDVRFHFVRAQQEAKEIDVKIR